LICELQYACCRQNISELTVVRGLAGIEVTGGILDGATNDIVFGSGVVPVPDDNVTDRCCHEELSSMGGCYPMNPPNVRICIKATNTIYEISYDATSKF
jgi:hypothetical protein